MKNFSTWLLVMFMAMFWAFRIFVTIGAELHWELGGLEPLNKQVEIILLFVVLLCMILVVKRKLVGGLIYLLAYGIYFGTNIADNVSTLLSLVEGELDINLYLNLFISFIGVILAVAVMLDLLADKGRKANPKDKKTDWFYKNEQFDRKLDERADKNNYRTM